MAELVKMSNGNYVTPINKFNRHSSEAMEVRKQDKKNRKRGRYTNYLPIFLTPNTEE